MTTAPPLWLHDIADAHGRPGWVRRYLFSTDHKTIGLQYLFAGLAFFTLGGGLAMLIRWQLAWPSDPRHPVPVLGRLLGWDQGIMPPDAYNVILTLHATVMIFLVLIPLQVGAFGNYLIPLKIGSRDMAFPVLNGLSFWLYLAGGAVLLAGVCLPGGGASAGWTSYPPLSSIPFNGGSNAAAARGLLGILQVRGGTWSSLPIAVNAVTLFLLFAFIGWQLLPVAVAVPTAAVAAAAAVRALQVVAFDGQSCWFVALIAIGFSSTLGAVNYITTILKQRCPGLTLFRLPMTVWNLLITSLLVLLATPVLAAALTMNLLDHHGITSFFEPAGWVLSARVQANAGGGTVLLDPHLFWFYSHPAVYIMILPVFGMVSDILPTFSRKPLFGYHAMVVATAAIAGLGFLVWGHHMFQSGMNPTMGAAFAVSTMLIAVPSGIKTFNWLATLWGGTLHLTVPMLNACAFVSLFVIGGLSGIITASTPIDAQLHMTYFIVAHIHYVLFGGSTFGLFAGIYYWYPKMFGRMTNPALGYIHTIASYVAFNCVFFPMHFLGLQGMPRRVADYTGYTSFAHLQPMNQFITISAFVLGLAQLPLIVNFFGSMIWGPKAGNNPWRATTLEWTDATSPPAAWNFDRIPTVYRGPYEYGNPSAAADFTPQSLPDVGDGRP
jgi:cytochrome c oxidase subunit 1